MSSVPAIKLFTSTLIADAKSSNDLTTSEKQALIKVATSLERCVVGYSRRIGCSQKLAGLFYRIWNAIKAIFGNSDWNKAVRALQKHSNIINLTKNKKLNQSMISAIKTLDVSIIPTHFNENLFIKTAIQLNEAGLNALIIPKKGVQSFICRIVQERKLQKESLVLDEKNISDDEATLSIEDEETDRNIETALPIVVAETDKEIEVVKQTQDPRIQREIAIATAEAERLQGDREIAQAEAEKLREERAIDPNARAEKQKNELNNFFKTRFEKQINNFKKCCTFLKLNPTQQPFTEAYIEENTTPYLIKHNPDRGGSKEVYDAIVTARNFLLHLRTKCAPDLIETLQDLLN